MQRRREQAGSAAEVDDAAAMSPGDERDQGVEGLLAFAAKTLVLRRVPGIAHAHAARGDPGSGVVSIGGQDSVALVRSRAWTGLAVGVALSATGCSATPSAPTTAALTPGPAVTALAAPAPPPLALPPVQ